MRGLMMAAVLAGVCGAAGLAGAATVYQQDFEGLGTLPAGLPTGWTGPGAVVSKESYPASTFGTAFLRNDSVGGVTKLTLMGLGAHTTADLEFDLATIDSWDGGSMASNSPNGDIFNVKVDGVLLFSKSFSNGLGEAGSYGMPPDSQGNYGFNAGWQDGAYRIKLLGITHSASTMTVEFFANGPGWQGSTDESFALDNVLLRTNDLRDPGTPVPTPAAAAGGAVLMGLMGAARRRK